MTNEQKDTPLNLPPAPFRTQLREGRPFVFDPLRQRFVRLTPEERVRQHFVHFLIHEKGYPAALMTNEIPLSVGLMQKRCDTVVYDRQTHPLMILEYKAPTVPITQRVFDQICRYNITLRVPYLIVSNGLHHYCCHVDYEKGACTFLPDIPSYAELAV